MLAGLWYLSILQGQAGARALPLLASLLSGLMFSIGACFVIGGGLTALGRAPQVVAGLLYFGAASMLVLALPAMWSIGAALLVVGGVLLLVATSVSTAPKPMVLAVGAAVAVVAGGFWLALDSPLTPRYQVVAPDFHLSGGVARPITMEIPPEAVRFLVPGTRGTDGRCTGQSMSGDMIPGGGSGRATFQLEQSQEACASIYASWPTKDGSSFSSSGGFPPFLRTPTPAP